MFVDQLEFSEFMDLSLMSPAIQRAARRREVAEFKWLIMSPGHFVIHITELDPLKPKLIFKLSSDAVKRVTRHRNTFTLKCGPGLVEKYLGFWDLSKTLLMVLEPRKYHFEGNYYLDFVFDFTKNFETFTMSNANLTLNQAKKILESIDVNVFRLENISFEGRRPRKLNLKHKNMFINVYKWFRFEWYLDMKCQKMTIENDVSLNDLLLFVKSWIDGNLENLEQCSFNMIEHIGGNSIIRDNFIEDLRKIVTVVRSVITSYKITFKLIA
uniref:FBA_2 domain-containing protein n=1 Tax=Caenorhabditis tropicalis TaxID=1561998 RepID=A0A1I7TTT0_9PELO